MLCPQTWVCEAAQAPCHMALVSRHPMATLGEPETHLWKISPR